MIQVMYSSLSDRNVTHVAWLEAHLHSFAHVGALFALILALSVPSSTLAVPLQLTGQYNGQVNGDTIIATATGQMETSGSSVNHIDIEFQSIPIDIHPSLAGNCWNSSYHGASVLPLGGALNLFDLSGGNYIASRTVRWPSLPGEQILFITNVTTAGGIMTGIHEVNGTYSGPTDLIGVTDYQMLWTQIDSTTIEITSTPTILRANGQSFVAEITMVYSGLSGQMPTNLQAGTITFSNESFSDNIMSLDWQGNVAPVTPVPTLSEWGMLIMGLLLLAVGTVAIVRRRKLSRINVN